MLNQIYKKNVAVFCGSLYRGGAERVTIYLANGLSNLGYHTEIITCSQKEIEYDLPSNVKRHILGDSSTCTLAMIKKLRTILMENHIDILIVITTPLSIYAMPAVAGLNIKVIVSERNDPTHFEGKKRTKYLSDILMRRADGFVFQTHDAKEYYKNRINGKGVVIHNPIFSNIKLTSSKEIPEKTIVAVGRLDPQKNHMLLIRSFAECDELNREYKLIIYGEGILRLKLEELVRELGMEGQIELPGNVPDVYNKIHNASLFVLSSNYEGMPNALIEAMALGLPCISTDCPIGGPSELIQDGINGILVPVGDKEALKGKMKEMLLIPGLGNEIGKAAKSICEKLSKEKILAQWADYIERILNE